MAVLVLPVFVENRPVNPDAFDTDGHYPAFVGSGKRGAISRVRTSSAFVVMCT
jgi:hypothetical protein